MKVVLTGSSGLIGGEVLNQCLRQSSITSIVILSRRALSEIASLDPRIKVIVLSDFTEFSPSNRDEIAGAEICIWTLGGSNNNPTPAGLADLVEVQYPLAAARALLETKSAGVKVRFLFVSGILSVREQEKSLWFLEEGRRARGLAEAKLDELAKTQEESFESVIVNCAGVLKKNSLTPDYLPGLNRLFIDAEVLGAAMVYVALHESGSRVVSNLELRRIGKAALKTL